MEDAKRGVGVVAGFLGGIYFCILFLYLSFELFSMLWFLDGLFYENGWISVSIGLFVDLMLVCGIFVFFKRSLSIGLYGFAWFLFALNLCGYGILVLVFKVSGLFSNMMYAFLIVLWIARMLFINRLPKSAS